MTSHNAISPAAELHANVSVPFEAAHAMPKSVYTSAAFLALEQTHVFAHDWLCAGRAEALPNPGDYLTMQIAGEPIVVLRDRDGQMRAMSNVCRHRMSTLLEGRGNTRSIVCPYHAWTYKLLQRGTWPAIGALRSVARLDHGHAEPRCTVAHNGPGRGNPTDRAV
jgi:nitrite reductase/ring-hydroxylating ferredoxin subunit